MKVRFIMGSYKETFVNTCIYKMNEFRNEEDIILFQGTMLNELVQVPLYT